MSRLWIKLVLPIALLTVSASIGVLVLRQNTPESHQHRLLAQFPALKRATILPGCGVGENYGYLLASKADYDGVKFVLEKKPWRKLDPTDYEGSLPGLLSTKVWVILHPWHRDKNIPHVVFGFSG